MVPGTPGELTVEWLSNTLGRTVDSFRIDAIGVDTGFAGSVFRLHLTHAGHSSGGPRPETVIWKTSSSHPRTHLLLTRLRAYQSEVNFLTRLAPLVPIAPETYFSEYDSSTGQVSILQRDLGGMIPGDQLEGCSLAQAVDVVRALASLHSTFWGEPGDGQTDVIPTFDSGAADFSRLHSISWRGLRHSLITVPSGLDDAANRIAPYVATVKRLLAAPPATMLHGDVRADNMFFGPNGPKFIDWQAVRRGRGAYDLAYFIATSLPIEVRRTYQSVLVDAYVGSLEESGVRGYTAATCLHDIRLSLLDIVVFVGIVGASLDFGSGRGLQLADAMMARVWAAVADNRALELLDQLDPDR